MERISFFFAVVIYASLYAHYVPASAAPEGKDVIMDEILQVMREYEQHKIDEEKNDEPEKSERKFVERYYDYCVTLLA